MSNDLWRTPQDTFDFFNERFNFQLDVAADKSNHLVDKYLGDDQPDGLKTCWSSLVRPGGYVWCNPPYSAPLPWVKKAIEQQAKDVGTVMLLNADFSTRAGRLATDNAQTAYITVGEWVNDVWYIGRIAFLNGDGEPTNSNNKGQAFYIFQPASRMDPFARGIETRFVGITTVQPSKLKKK